MHHGHFELVCPAAIGERNTMPPAEYKGIWRDKTSGTCHAAVTCDGPALYLGTFDTPVEATRAYDRKAIELHGEFARLNFPEERDQRFREIENERRQGEDGRQKTPS
jgi:hypothetical protein